MIKQLLRKRAKIAFGFFNTYIRKIGQAYDDTKWWDASFYTKGVSDKKTMSQGANDITAKYHYASVELQILKHLRNNEISTNQCSVLDIGSGAGHWIDFYKTLEARNVTGMDVSHSSYKHLAQKYSGDASVEIHCGRALEVLSDLKAGFDIVNAVGVMFHIVDDLEWEKTIFSVANILKDKGLFVVGGHFGIIGGLNVQIDKDASVNKRLRSKKRWVRTLKKVGFTSIRIYRNNAYLWIRDSLPENNVLVATK